MRFCSGFPFGMLQFSITCNGALYGFIDLNEEPMPSVRVIYFGLIELEVFFSIQQGTI